MTEPERSRRLEADWRWCRSPESLLKWALLLLATTELALTKGARTTWAGYSFFALVAILILLYTVASLLFFVFKLEFHLTFMSPETWEWAEVGLNIGYGLLCILCVALGVHDCLRMWDGDWTHHRSGPPQEMEPLEWRNRVAGFTACAGLAALIHLASAAVAKRRTRHPLSEASKDSYDVVEGGGRVSFSKADPLSDSPNIIVTQPSHTDEC